MVVRGVVIMLDITEMKKLLKASLPHKRFKHSLAVYDTALELAVFYGLDKEKVGVGALLHDCGREIPTRDLLMHTIALPCLFHQSFLLSTNSSDGASAHSCSRL